MRLAIASSSLGAPVSGRRRLLLPFSALALSALALVGVVPHVLAAQGPGVLTGTVVDTSGLPISGAAITLAGERVSALSDAGGTFRIQRLGVGRHTVQVRRIGFRPAEVDVEISGGEAATVVMRLDRVAPTLEAVIVAGQGQRSNPRIAAFYDRRERGFGHFITRADIDRRQPLRTTDLLRTIPGVRMRLVNSSRSVLYFRGSTCPPLVYIDGAPAAAAYFDPDLITPMSIEGIEVYHGPSSVPVQFTNPHQTGGCGVIAIWSRVGLPPPRRRSVGDNARMLGDLLARNHIFTANQVDSAAVLADSTTAKPDYPERMLREGVGGLVIAEFVVDTLGRVERETLGLVSSSHRELADAVMVALTRAIFRPALRDGRRVRQLVQQPFTFEPRPREEDARR
ncbi:MAG TPA: TonB family protein [Gemmatimonadaceae bacterium]|nr:TonB family protein [Gemmatimonadaceae bacterium]